MGSVTRHLVEASGHIDTASAHASLGDPAAGQVYATCAIAAAISALVEALQEATLQNVDQKADQFGELRDIIVSLSNGVDK